MAVPETQLDAWSKIGAVTQSRNTYATVKSVLEDSGSPYYSKSFASFLQGSYANDTNVYRDSDVDVILRLDSTWYHDANLLPADQYAAFERAYPGSTNYGLSEFKAQVAAWLRQKFGDTVRIGSKAILIPGNGSRRDCDVLPCARFKYYWKFKSTSDESLAEGICFFLSDGTRIVNFPKQHSDNCTSKHQATAQWFKPTVRIFKNMRNHMVDSGALQDGIAPSYFIEGMLWNVPTEKYGRNWQDTFVNTYNYIASADRSLFKCANGIHSLLGGSPVNWSASNCQAFLNALQTMWNSWGR